MNLFRKLLPAILATALSHVSWAAPLDSDCVQLVQTRKFQQAIALCEAKASEGDAEAQFWRGMLEPDAEWERGDEWLSKSAAQDFEPALHELGLRNQRSGKGRTADIQLAMKYVRDAAERGYIPAQLELGIALMHGRWGVTDEVAARQWLMRAAEGGSGEAMRRMAESYASHRHAGDPSSPGDDKQANEWRMKSAQHGDAYAQWAIAGELLQGEGRAKDNVEGFAWLLLAAASDDPTIERSKNTFSLQVTQRDQENAYSPSTFSLLRTR